MSDQEVLMSGAALRARAGSAVSVEGIAERLDVSEEFVEDVLYGRYAGIESLE